MDGIGKCKKTYNHTLAGDLAIRTACSRRIGKPAKHQIVTRPRTHRSRGVILLHTRRHILLASRDHLLEATAIFGLAHVSASQLPVSDSLTYRCIASAMEGKN